MTTILICICASNALFNNKKYEFLSKQIFDNLSNFIIFTLYLNYINYLVSFYVILVYIPDYLFDFFSKNGYILSLILGLKEGIILSLLWIHNENIQKSNFCYRTFYLMFYFSIILLSFYYLFFIRYKLIECFYALI
ncbi:MAG TPA: hypothetical protein DDW90_01250 [Cyanobacteria bacterium UBA9971]|nr:hypothetical protein [Cyanobacteria bacterium UBA9971]